MNTFVLKDSVSKAEIIWALQTVMSRRTLNIRNQVFDFLTDIP